MAGPPSVVVLTDKHRVPFQVDEGDHEGVSHYAWHIDGAGYPITTCGKWPTRRPVRLHVFLLGPAPAGLVWDHVNGDKRDNRRANLRAVTNQVNTLKGRAPTAENARRATCSRCGGPYSMRTDRNGHTRRDCPRCKAEQRLASRRRACGWA